MCNTTVRIIPSTILSTRYITTCCFSFGSCFSSPLPPQPPCPTTTAGWLAGSVGRRLYCLHQVVQHQERQRREGIVRKLSKRSGLGFGQCVRSRSKARKVRRAKQGMNPSLCRFPSRKASAAFLLGRRSRTLPTVSPYEIRPLDDQSVEAIIGALYQGSPPPHAPPSPSPPGDTKRLRRCLKYLSLGLLVGNDAVKHAAHYVS